MVESKDKSYGHELQWLRLEASNLQLSISQNDVYDRRAQSCTRLLQRFC